MADFVQGDLGRIQIAAGVGGPESSRTTVFGFVDDCDRHVDVDAAAPQCLHSSDTRLHSTDAQQPLGGTVRPIASVQRGVPKNTPWRLIGTSFVADDIDAVDVEEVLVTRKRILVAAEEGFDPFMDVVNVVGIDLIGRIAVTDEDDINAIRRGAVVDHGIERLRGNKHHLQLYPPTDAYRTPLSNAGDHGQFRCGTDDSAHVAGHSNASTDRWRRVAVLAWQELTIGIAPSSQPRCAW